MASQAYRGGREVAYHVFPAKEKSPHTKHSSFFFSEVVLRNHITLNSGRMNCDRQPPMDRAPSPIEVVCVQHAQRVVSTTCDGV